MSQQTQTYNVNQQKSPPPCCMQFSDIFWQMVQNFKSIFLHTHLLYVPIYARWQIFIQLSQTLTKLYHIKRDYLFHVICSKCPPSAETHAFRRLRKSLIALLIVICGKSSHMTWHQQWRHLLSKQTYKLSSSEMPKIWWVVSLSMAQLRQNWG